MASGATGTLVRDGLLSCFVAAALVPLVIAIARRKGFLDHPGPRKIHAEPVPYGGGLAVAISFLAFVVGEYLVSMPDGAPFTLSHRPQIVVMVLGSLVILVLGIVDDRRRLSARFKLAVQTIVALGVAVGGLRLELFNAGLWLSIPITVFWILAVTNAFNLLDHMDGLTGGVAILAGAAFLAVALQTGQGWMARMLVVLIGACLGFLFFNFPPAKIFLGDAGSLFIGFWLSCLTISFTFYDAHYPLYTYLVPVAVLGVPLFDTTSVLIIRLLKRKPLFEGDTNHLAHRLTALGMSRRAAVLTVYALTLATGISAALLYHVTQTGAVLILVQLLLTFGIITLLETAGRRHDG